MRFNTLEASKHLQEVGFDDIHAEAIVKVVYDAQEQLATKADIDLSRSETEQFRNTVKVDTEHLKEGFDELDSKFVGLKSNFDELDSKFDGLKTDFDGLKTDFDGLKSDIVGLKSDIVGLKTDFDGLKSDIVGLKSDIVGLKTDFDGLKSDFVGLKTDFVGLVSKFDNLKAEITQFRSETNSRFERLESDIQWLRWLAAGQIALTLTAIGVFVTYSS